MDFPKEEGGHVVHEPMRLWMLETETKLLGARQAFLSMPHFPRAKSHILIRWCKNHPPPLGSTASLFNSKGAFGA